MWTMKIQINKKVSPHNGLLVIPIFQEDLKKMPTVYPTAVKNFVYDSIKYDNFKASFGETIVTNISNKNLPRKLLIIGLGKEKNFHNSKSRIIGAKIAKLSKQIKARLLSLLLLPELENSLEELAEGLLLLQYDLGKFKTKKKHNKSALEKIELITMRQSRVAKTMQTDKDLEEQLKKAEMICEAVSFVKDLVNSPSNFVDSEYLAKTAEKIAKDNKYSVTIFGKKELEKAGWGGLLAVNQGSAKEPKCIILEYNGLPAGRNGAENSKEKPIVLIGKGVIFDTGGYNLKPTNHIETMHQDMAGAAAVLGVFTLLKKLNIKKNVIGITPVVENMISCRAYKPSDIITMLSGQTVEITNTDAEGRLILADAITYGGRLKPEFIISIATLTGAVAVALGDRYAGILSNSAKLRRDLGKTGRQVDELVWPLPVHKDFNKKFNSLVADMKNCDLGTSRLAGSCKGAAFLERFFGKNKWCHIDIGGTAFISDPLEFQTKGSTAYGLRLLVRFLENLGTT